MKTSRHIFMLSAVVLALAACTQNDLADGNNLPEGEYPLVIETTGVKDVASRATVNGNWEGVTDVALQVGAEVKTYTVSASGANKENAMLSSTAPFYWTSRENITVTAWWPYNAADLSMPEVKVKADQSSLENFKSSDYIYAHSDAVEFEHPTLEFTHRTVRVTVELVSGNDIYLIWPSVSLNNLKADHENPESIIPYQFGYWAYDALVAPQTILSGQAFITVRQNAGIFNYIPETEIELESGKRYNYKVKVNGKVLELISCTITDWNDVNDDIEAELADFIYDKSTNTYTVYTAEGLYEWANYVNVGNGNTNCILANDIILPDATKEEGNWTPVNAYTGTFDGDNHTIYGVKINLPSNENVGFFGSVGNGGTVKNLTLKDVDVKGNVKVGGITGSNGSGTITNCYSAGNVVASSSKVGGIVGESVWAWPSGNTTYIIACGFMGNVSGNEYVGGVVGYCSSGSPTACYSSGSISGVNYVAGIAGYNYGNTLTACYSNGNITGNWSVGAVIGSNESYLIVKECYWSGIITGYDNNYTQDTEIGDNGITWESATLAMNTALEAKNSEWRYVQGEDKNIPPTLQKQ